MNDLISRQAVIDKIIKYCMKYDLRDLLAEIEVLSSAELSTEFDSENDELISKQDAVWAVHVRIKQIGYENDPNVLSIRQAVREVPSVQLKLAKNHIDHEITKDVLDRWKSEMSASPIIIAEPERKKGKWIEHHRTDLGEKLNHCIECSECKIWFSIDELLRRSFCPNCGADMRGEQDVHNK